MNLQDDLRQFIKCYIHLYATGLPSSIEDFNDWYRVASSEWACIRKNMEFNMNDGSINSPRVKAIIELFEKAENIFHEVAVSNSYSPVFHGWPEIRNIALPMMYT